MQFKSESDMDKSSWGPGPWQDEPDKLQWLDEETGLPCIVVRNHSGALCGYVGVPPEHPLFGVAYNTPLAVLKELWDRRKDTPIGTLASGPVALLLTAYQDDQAPSADAVFEVHGGLTYAAGCSGRICHEREDGDPEAWWFGFDCAHYRDLVPGRAAIYGLEWDTEYRDLSYVQAECQKLARQLKEVRT